MIAVRAGRLPARIFLLEPDGESAEARVLLGEEHRAVF